MKPRTAKTHLIVWRVYNVAKAVGEQQVAMDASTGSRPSVLGFGVFELDCRAGELRKSGVLIHLPPQPFNVLALLAGRPGQIVTREGIRQEIWSDDTFVDFEQGLNHCIRQIRTALGDDAETPRYIETLPRRGYRFIYPVTTASQDTTSPGETTATEGPGSTGAASTRRREGKALSYKFVALAAALVVLIVVAVVALNVVWLRNRLLGRSTGPPKIHSIAVLPLENLSRDPEQEYFADGMTDELITTLGKISALRVISRTSVMRYKGTRKPLLELARELNVDAIVEGTVERSGDRVRITANLIYAPADRHLWADSYERDLGDVLSLQDEVALAIAGQIKAKVTPQEQLRLTARGSVNPEAYRLYLQGRYYYFKRTLPAFDKSIQLYQQALEKDPNSALAYAGLSESYSILPFYDLGAKPKDDFPKARVAALKALELDSTLAEAHTALGSVLFYYDWDWPAAEKELKRAIELKPSYVVAHEWYADYLLAMGRCEPAYAEISRAQELDPASPLMRAIGGEVCLFSRRRDEAIEQCRKGLELDPDFGLAHLILGFCYLGKGMYREALPEFDEANRLYGRDPTLDRARVYIAAGRRDDAMGLLGRLWQRYKQGEVSPHALAPLYAALGEKRRALDLAEDAYERRDPYMVYLNVDPQFDPLRSDPRFQSILRRMNFPPQNDNTRPKP